MHKTMDLSNFSKLEEKRYILVLGDWKKNDEDLRMLQNRINKQLALIIQELSIRIPERQIPFAKVEFVREETNERLRIIVFDKENDSQKPEIINKNKLSHLITVRLTEAYCSIIYDAKRPYANAEMIIGDEYTICATIDIMLDIVMFNSYSFLRELSEKDKKLFSSKKYQRFKDKKYNSFFHYKTLLEKEPNYFSFAFAARENKSEIDIDQYIYLWNDFINDNYPEEKNIIKPVMEQLQYHKSFNQITKPEAKKDITALFDTPGTKLLLRTNRGVRNKALRMDIRKYFGAPKYRMGLLKVVDLWEYHNPWLSKALRNGYITAFKVIVTEDNLQQ